MVKRYKAGGGLPKKPYNATQVLTSSALMSNHGPSLQPLDKQVEQVRHSIASIETDLDKAVRAGKADKRNRLAGLLTAQRAKLAYLLDKLAASPGFAPGITYKPKKVDHTSYHPAGTKPQAGQVRKPKVTQADKARMVATLEREALANDTRYSLGKPKGTKA